MLTNYRARTDDLENVVDWIKLGDLFLAEKQHADLLVPAECAGLLWVNLAQAFTERVESDKRAALQLTSMKHGYTTKRTTICDQDEPQTETQISSYNINSSANWSSQFQYSRSTSNRTRVLLNGLPSRACHKHIPRQTHYYYYPTAFIKWIFSLCPSLVFASQVLYRGYRFADTICL